MVEHVGKSPMQVLMSLLHSKSYVYEFSTTGSNELGHLFFVHRTSFDTWRAFPHVLIIDATYKTNNYNMPFVQIVGVTSTNKTFSIAFAFIQNEKTDSYTWVLNCLKLTLEKCMHPRVIVTDRELALVNACKEVFPDVPQLLCRWHISQNIFRHCRQSIRSTCDWDIFLSLWKSLEDSATLVSYTENYKKLQSFLTKYPSVFKYVNENWLDKYKHMFVSVWIDRHLNFGNNTTNRVESQHAVLKKYLKMDVNLLYHDLCFFGSPCPQEHWMKMPEAGVLIANRFGVIVHSLSISGSSTIFPFWSDPEESQPRKALTIALVNNEMHYVMVELQGEYLMPFITPYWNYNNISQRAVRWESMYRPLLDLYTQLCRRENGFVDLSS